jgi:hypothetical protein
LQHRLSPTTIAGMVQQFFLLLLQVSRKREKGI